MSRVSSFVVEEEVVAALPLCVRRLRGPGLARRLPPGSAYRSAGAVLRRVLLYSEDGQARVQVFRTDGLGVPKERSTSGPSTVSPLPPVSATGAGASTATAATASSTGPSGSTKTGTPPAKVVTSSNFAKWPASLSSVGLMSEAQEEGINTRHATHISSQDASVVHTRSQLRRERAATLATETERRYEEEQESTLAGLLHALPLLRVVPPLSLKQQAYTQESSPPVNANASRNTAYAMDRASQLFPSSSHFITSPNRPNSNISIGSSSNGAVAGGVSPAALRVAQARYGAGYVGGSVGGDAARANAVIRDQRGLGLSAAILLSKEETTKREFPQAPAAAPDAEAVVKPELLATATATPPSPVPQSGNASQELRLAEAAPATADATSAALNDIFIDGGLNVTIKLGASCDEPHTLRYVVWGGCKPVVLRAVVWRLLSDYAPVQVSRQHAELERKRRQYEGYTRQYCSALTMLADSEPAVAAAAATGASSSSSSFMPPSPTRGGGAETLTTSVLGGAAAPQRESASLSRLTALPRPGATGVNRTSLGGGGSNNNSGADVNIAAASLASHERAIIRQMLLDLPRHKSPVFHARRSVAGMARCLFLWSQRHPAVGYVQGMDDVVAIFYQVFLTDALRQYASEQLMRQGRSSSPSAVARARLGAVPGERNSNQNTSYDSVEDAEWDEKSSERITREIMRLLLASLHAHRTTAGSASSTPTASSFAETHVVAPCLVNNLAPGASELTADVATTTSARTAATRATPVDASLTLLPFLTEAYVDVYFRNPAALDAALADLPESYLTQVEADTFFCVGRVLSFLQDNFMTGQPGILRNVRRLEALVRVVDPAVIVFMEEYGLTVMDGCFQWMHCLLARELPLSLLLRLWDCYLAIGIDVDRPLNVGMTAGLPSTSGVGGGGVGATSSDEAIMYFHVCICCALLRMVHTHLTGGPTATSATTETTTMTTVGGWAAALVTALPGFRSRATQSSSGESNAAAAASSRARPSIDEVMTSLKRPFEALFPNYPTTAVKQQRWDAAQQQQRPGGAAVRGPAAPQSAPPPPAAAELAEEDAAERWLDLLIADAYCIWRLHPVTS